MVPCARSAPRLPSRSCRHWRTATGEKSLTRTVSSRWSSECLRRAAQLVGLALLLNGCRPHPPPVYQNQQGFHFTPPPGWVERARDDGLPSKAYQACP
jgi:hypothetical protein